MRLRAPPLPCAGFLFSARSFTEQRLGAHRRACRPKLDWRGRSLDLRSGAAVLRNWGIPVARFSSAAWSEMVPLTTDSVSHRQEPRGTLAGHVRSRISGAAAGTFALAGRDSSRRLAGPRAGRLHDPLRQPGRRIHYLRDVVGGCALSFDGVFVLFTADVGSHAVCLRHGSVEPIPGLAARTRQAKAAEGTG